MKKVKASTKLSIMYAILSVILILLLAITFYKFNKDNIYKESINNLQQMSESIMIKIDNRLENMEQVTIEVLGNNEFYNHWKQEVDYYNTEENKENESNIRKILIQSYMNKPDIRRVAVYNEDGYYISTGRSNVSRHEILERIKVTIDIEKMNYTNSRVFLSPHNDFWDSNSTGKVISVIKPIKDREKNIIGYIEVQQNAFYIENICDVKFNDSKLDTMVFMGDNDNLFFTNTKQDNYQKRYLENIQKITSQYSKIRDNGKQIILTVTSNYYQGRTVCILEKSVVYKSLRNILNGIIIIVIVLIIISIGYSVITTRFIMEPINLLVERMKYADLFDFDKQDPIKVKDRETEILVNSFENMTQRFQESILHQKKLEDIQTKTLFSILQSEISPHFLYNTLGSIANMCEREEAEEAADACYSLTEILRYSSNYATREVRVMEEMDNLSSYLLIMKSRYRQRLQYEIITDEEAKYFMLPKLTYQPLVENAIKYSLLEQDHVIIKVYTVLLGDHMFIEIKDNGCGITKEAGDEIAQKIKEFKEDKGASDITEKIQIGGMGLAGTLIRLSIFYGEDFQYELLNNNDEGGSTIVLKINMEKHK